jgi:probable F420-dependent oxidoreductase
VKFGINFLASDSSADVRELGRRIEQAGFESFFMPEHTHIPVHGDVHWAGPDVHHRMPRLPDPLISLTAVAAVTERLRVGTGVMLVAQHDPITLAKRIATLDVISGGRFMLGVGTGWNRTEALNHGVAPRHRWARMRENVLAMKRVWTYDAPEFHGEFVNFDPIQSWPKPAQRPHPPVIVGGEGPTVHDRVLEYGDAWGPHPEPDTVERIARLRERARAAGRPPIPVTLFNVPLDVDLIRRYADAGVERCVLYIYDDGPDSVARDLDRYARFIASYR